MTNTKNMTSDEIVKLLMNEMVDYLKTTQYLVETDKIGITISNPDNSASVTFFHDTILSVSREANVLWVRTAHTSVTLHSFKNIHTIIKPED